MKLTYMGPAPGSGALPLPEGWPALDHEEPDAEVAKAKVSSGSYRAAGVAASPAGAGATTQPDKRGARHQDEGE